MAFVKNLITGGPKPKQAQVVDPFTNQQVVSATGDVNSGLNQQQAFANALGAQNGIGNQAAVFAQQQALANQLQQQANGQGPNVALDQLNQTTGQNVANQAALMAGGRGASANAGLIARQAAQQGAGIQQQATGQAATLGAQQQIAARQALMQQQGQMAGLAGTQVGQQQGAVNAYQQGALGAQQNDISAVTGQNSANVSNVGQYNQAQGQRTANQMAVLGGLAKGGASAFGLALNKGGEVPGPSSLFGKHLCGGGIAAMKSGGPVAGKPAVKGDSIKNDTVPAMLSPGEVVIPRHIMQSKDAPKRAAEFVRQVMAKKRKSA